MKKFSLLIIALITVLSSCKEDCDECFTPPISFEFEFVDKTTGENLFSNGTYEHGQVSIINTLDNNTPMHFDFITTYTTSFIRVGGIGWQTETVNLEFRISNNYIFDFYVDAIRKSENCCNFTDYNEIGVYNTEFEYSSETGIYKILIE